MEFRLLRADEIDCRISIVQSWGIGLLLYKDARCDQNILDETVGAMNWQRHHLRDNANCIVSIWDDQKQQWIEKEDTGTESNTEREKGLASDSFKRSCFNWGIGRELYTAPNMTVYSKDLTSFEKDDRNRYTCKDRFVVTDIQYDGRKIQSVTIKNVKSGKLLTFGEKNEENIENKPIGKTKGDALRERCEKDGLDLEKVLAMVKADDFENITEYNHAVLIKNWEKMKERCKSE